MTKPTKNRRNQPLIEVTNLSFSYGNKKILSDINFSVEPNTFVAVLGINGTGKSTLIALALCAGGQARRSCVQA